MATVTRYVNLASTPGGDGTTNATTGANRAYASLAEWDTAEATDLVSAGDIHEVRLTGDGQDTSPVGIGTGWTTDASNYVRIIVEEGSRHDGRSRQVSGSGYQLGAATLAAVAFACNLNIEVYYLDIYRGDGPACRPSGTVLFESCIISSDHTGTIECLDFQNSNPTVIMRNCIVFSSARPADCRGSASTEISHCTFWCRNDQLTFIADAGTVTNCYAGKASGSADDFWTGGTAPSGSHNASSDATATTDYTSSLTSKAGSDQFVSVTSGSEDFTLKSGSDLEAAGTPLGAVTDDIIGTARDGTSPDIGAFEFVAAGGGGTLVSGRLVNRSRLLGGRLIA